MPGSAFAGGAEVALRGTGRSAGDRGLLRLDGGVPGSLPGLPALLGVAPPPVAGDGGELRRQSALGAQMPTQLADRARLTVHEDVALPVGQRGGPHRSDQRLPRDAVPTV